MNNIARQITELHGSKIRSRRQSALPGKSWSRLMCVDVGHQSVIAAAT